MTIPINADIVLEPIDQKHAQELFELVVENRNHLREWLPWVDNMQDVAFIQNFISGSNQRNKEGNEYAFVIIGNNKIVGRIGVYKIDNQNKIGEIGYWVMQGLQGRGIIAGCTKAIIDHCFQHLQLNRIEIKCATENSKSQKIPERLGFKFEGTIRQGEWVHKRFVDLKLYSVLKEEWAL
jgi:ribosomal-protein-serine acetyltransferase